ncbi:MAG: twin-arginine translocation signal domain-containing protein, partial [Planctomycetota bacterium]
MNKHYDRRDFLKLGAAVGTGLTVSSISSSGWANLQKDRPEQIKTAPINPVRIGFVGVGNRGSHLVKLLLTIEGIEIRAVCDIVQEKVARAQHWVQEAGQSKPD